MMSRETAEFKTAVLGWIIALLIVFSPGGVITQIWSAKYRIAENYAASPLGQVCYYCRKPATHFQAYTNGEVLYLCDEHKAPSDIVRSYGSTSTPGNGYNPLFCTALVLTIPRLYSFCSTV